MLLPPGEGTDDMGLAQWMQLRLLPLRGMPPEEINARLESYFAVLDVNERFVCAKLITGSFRVGVSKLLVTRALAQAAEIDAKIVAQRMMGYTDITARPDARGFSALLAPESAQDDERADGRPYPFFLAHPLQIAVQVMDEQLGPPDEWIVEWKWDGIRAQLVRRAERAWVGTPG